MSQSCARRPPGPPALFQGSPQTAWHAVQNGDSNAQSGVSATDLQLATMPNAPGLQNELRRTQTGSPRPDDTADRDANEGVDRRPSDPRSARISAAEFDTKGCSEHISRHSPDTWTVRAAVLSAS